MLAGIGDELGFVALLSGSRRRGRRWQTPISWLVVLSRPGAPKWTPRVTMSTSPRTTEGITHRTRSAVTSRTASDYSYEVLGSASGGTVSVVVKATSTAGVARALGHRFERDQRHHRHVHHPRHRPGGIPDPTRTATFARNLAAAAAGIFQLTSGQRRSRSPDRRRAAADQTGTSAIVFGGRRSPFRAGPYGSQTTSSSGFSPTRHRPPTSTAAIHSGTAPAQARAACRPRAESGSIANAATQRPPPDDTRPSNFFRQRERHRPGLPSRPELD